MFGEPLVRRDVVEEQQTSVLHRTSYHVFFQVTT